MSGLSTMTSNGAMAQNHNMTLAYATTCGVLRGSLEYPLELTEAVGGAVNIAAIGVYNITQSVILDPCRYVIYKAVDGYSFVDRKIREVSGNTLSLSFVFTLKEIKETLPYVMIGAAAVGGLAQLIARRLADDPIHALQDGVVIGTAITRAVAAKVGEVSYVIAIKGAYLSGRAVRSMVQLPGRTLGLVLEIPYKKVLTAIASHRVIQILVGYMGLEMGYQNYCQEYEDALQMESDGKKRFLERWRSIDNVPEKVLQEKNDDTPFNYDYLLYHDSEKETTIKRAESFNEKDRELLKAKLNENSMELKEVLRQLAQFNRCADESGERQQECEKLIEKKFELNAEYNRMTYILNFKQKDGRPH